MKRLLRLSVVLNVILLGAFVIVRANERVAGVFDPWSRVEPTLLESEPRKLLLTRKARRSEIDDSPRVAGPETILVDLDLAAVTGLFDRPSSSMAVGLRLHHYVYSLGKALGIPRSELQALSDSLRWVEKDFRDLQRRNRGRAFQIDDWHLVEVQTPLEGRVALKNRIVETFSEHLSEEWVQAFEKAVLSHLLMERDTALVYAVNAKNGRAKILTGKLQSDSSAAILVEQLKQRSSFDFDYIDKLRLISSGSSSENGGFGSDVNHLFE